MRGDVVAVRVAYKDMPGLGPMGIKPQAEAGQVNAALMIFERECGHAGKLAGRRSKSMVCLDAGGA